MAVHRCKQARVAGGRVVHRRDLATFRVKGVQVATGRVVDILRVGNRVYLGLAGYSHPCLAARCDKVMDAESEEA